MVAEVVLFLVAIMCIIITYFKSQYAEWDLRDIFVVISKISMAMFSSTIVGLLLFNAVAVTSEAERLPHLLEEVKMEEWHRKAREEKESVATRHYLDRFSKLAEFVIWSDCAFAPYGVKINAKLALSVLYLSCTIGLGGYAEFFMRG